MSLSPSSSCSSREPSVSWDACESGGPVGGLSSLVETTIPLALRQTSRYRPLNDAIVELRAAWRDRRYQRLLARISLSHATRVKLRVILGEDEV